MNSLSSSQRPAAQPVSRSSTGRSIAYIAVFAALVAVLGLPGNIPLPGLVPITAQTLGVMLAGAILGPWRGAASMALFLILVAIGLPLLSGGRGGLGAFVGPSAGYLVSWILGAAVIGWVMRSGDGRPTWTKCIVGCLLGGILAIYAVGIPVQSFVTGMSMSQAALSSLAFIPGDLIKLVIACLVTMSLWKAYPRAFQR
ncbi:biotin transporter BioY [Kocuria massiliensis]|uniref:biotin transporter BioY n=1 Tax=Kocuria massiliensis TaxID=1926282 RepID=UPI000A1CB515|nr:biotin transporter BioY [Kocuria massiliensis]